MPELKSQTPHKSKNNFINNINKKIERSGRLEWYSDGTIHFLPDDGYDNDIEHWTHWAGRAVGHTGFGPGSFLITAGELFFEKIETGRFLLQCVVNPFVSIPFDSFAKNKSLNYFIP